MPPADLARGILGGLWHLTRDAATAVRDTATTTAETIHIIHTMRRRGTHAHQPPQPKPQPCATTTKGKSNG